jgi:hypothetical protein
MMATDQPASYTRLSNAEELDHDSTNDEAATPPAIAEPVSPLEATDTAAIISLPPFSRQWFRLLGLCFP